MIKKNVIRAFVIMLCLLMVMHTEHAYAANAKKIEIGAAMIGLGVVLGQQAVSNAICFGNCHNGADAAEVVASLSLITVGTVILVSGIRQSKSSTKKQRKAFVNQKNSFPYGPSDAGNFH